MLPNREGAAAAPGGRGAEPGGGSQRARHRGAEVPEQRREGPGVQDWPDGDKYDGEFMDGFKHGAGRYSWRHGEYYEGSFYKDYRHGDGVYCWPTGHKFIGKFYLNRKEGYGRQLFPDGATFQGLYHADQRFGPGVVSEPSGCQDVGLWLGKRLLKLCTSVNEGFSLKNLPEYAAYLDPAVTSDSLHQPPFLANGLQRKARTQSELDTELLSDEDFILPPGMESYSTDGDHLPLPPGRRTELDRLFYGELWEPDVHPYQGYEPDPLATLPLQARMQAYIHKHRLQAEHVDWDVAAVLSLNRDGFGPKGPLEISSEQLIEQASRGDVQAVSQILQTGSVHPDVADSQGHTALIAATVNCHNDVIQLLLDMYADIDKLNCEGMSALAVCHVLYYPFHSLHDVSADPPDKSQVWRSQSVCGTSPQPRTLLDSATHTPGPDTRPQTTDTVLSNQSHLSEHSTEEQTEPISHHSSKVSNYSELTTDCCSTRNEPETPADTKHLREQERAAIMGGGGGERDSSETERVEHVREKEVKSRKEEREKGGEHGETEMKRLEREMNERETKEVDAEFVEKRETESGKENVEIREEVEEGVETLTRSFNEDEDLTRREDGGSEELAGVERSIQVMDGPIALGSVQWRERGLKAGVRLQQQQSNDRGLTLRQSFDSARSVSSYDIQVTEEVMQCSAEALSHTGIPQCSDTQETVRKMAAMKTEHRVRLSTLKLLLDRGADPNVSRVPMPVLFLAIMAADVEAVRRLLLCGARTDIPLPPQRKGLYPLHVAATLQGPEGPRITELLLHAATDPDTQACDQDDIYGHDEILLKAQKTQGTNDSPCPRGGGRTALHLACQRDSDYRNASMVVALLLSHRARTDLLWSGHSPLSLAIASGNDLAVEELLKAGADPNLRLGQRVGSALCVLANIHYHLGGNRAKLLDMLAKAGANILMPVQVGDVMGTAVDYAYYSFNQDSRIAKTPFHALNMREREIFKARSQLLSMMGDLLRQAAIQREREQHLLNRAGATSLEEPNVSCESPPAIAGRQWKADVFKFCYHCGRSATVKLTACSRCHKVFYCSRTCKLKAWDERHKEECVRASASATGFQKTVVFKTQRSPGPLNVLVKSKTARPFSAKLRSQRLLEPPSMAEKVLESQVNLKENYSCN